MLEMSHGKSQPQQPIDPEVEGVVAEQAHAMPIALSTGGICLPHVVTVLIDEPPRRARGARRPRRRGARCFPRRREDCLGSDTERAAPLQKFSRGAALHTSLKWTMRSRRDSPRARFAPWPPAGAAPHILFLAQQDARIAAAVGRAGGLLRQRLRQRTGPLDRARRC